MNNMHSHHIKMVTKLFDDENISYKFLPPYSLDLIQLKRCDQR